MSGDLPRDVLPIADRPVAPSTALDAKEPVAEVEVTRALSYPLLFGFGTRASAVLLIAMSTVCLRGGVFTRGFARAGYLVGAALLQVVLRRERARRLTPALAAA